jgi:hypothetical protein
VKVSIGRQNHKAQRHHSKESNQGSTPHIAEHRRTLPNTAASLLTHRRFIMPTPCYIAAK